MYETRRLPDMCKNAHFGHHNIFCKNESSKYKSNLSPLLTFLSRIIFCTSALVSTTVGCFFCVLAFALSSSAHLKAKYVPMTESKRLLITMIITNNVWFCNE